ncbi:hypothetical protein [Spirillospora sp. NPDC047279]|uniref:hypothetical protein n=1 Tax=Spirillospora sp. NPDC047279 TaxID=3155478 RepID=UPI00340BE08A
MALRTAFLTFLLLLLCAPPAAADCGKLRGAAEQHFGRSSLCRNLEQELMADRPDFGRAFRESIRKDQAGNTRRPRTPVKKARPRTPSAPKATREAARTSVPTTNSLPARAPLPTQAPPSLHKAPATRTPPSPRGSVSTTPRTGSSTFSTPVAQAADTTHGIPRGILPTVVAVVLLLLAFAFHQVLTRPVAVPALRLPSPRPEPSPPSPTALGVAEGLARPLGLGVVGAGANGFVRAVLVELLTRDAKVVITRNELNRLFEGDFDETLDQAFPHLQVCATVQEASRHLELDQLMAEAEQANPDLSPTRGRGATTYWISAPHHEVAYLLRRSPNLVGLLFGAWPPGVTCTVGPTGKIVRIGDRDTDLRPPSLHPADALSILRSETWF